MSTNQTFVVRGVEYTDYEQCANACNCSPELVKRMVLAGTPELIPPASASVFAREYAKEQHLIKKRRISTRRKYNVKGEMLTSREAKDKYNCTDSWWNNCKRYNKLDQIDTPPKRNRKRRS